LHHKNEKFLETRGRPGLVPGDVSALVRMGDAVERGGHFNSTVMPISIA
jgi:hypothetical protein